MRASNLETCLYFRPTAAVVDTEADFHQSMLWAKMVCLLPLYTVDVLCLVHCTHRMVFSVDMLHTLGVAPQLCLVSRTFRRRSPQITSLATVLGKGLHEEEITFEMVSTLKMEMHLYHLFHTHIHQFQFRISPLCWYESGWPKWELHFVQAHTKNHIQKRNFQSDTGLFCQEIHSISFFSANLLSSSSKSQITHC